MFYTKQQMVDDLRSLGIKAGDVVFMHSSFKSLGQVDGGAATVFAALQEVLTEEGTLLLPAFSYENVNKENPVFSVKDTPVCVGYLPEYFRTRVEGVVRSIHPTHSVCAWGKLAVELTKDHVLDETPVGPHSPLYLLRQYGGKVLFLGCGVECDTTMHGVEEEIPVPYVFSPREKWDYTVIPEEGEPFEIHHIRHLHIIGKKRYDQRFTRLFSILDPAQYAVGPVLDSTSYLIASSTIWETAKKKMQEDPFFFVEETDV